MEDQQRLNSLINEINAYRQQAELIQQQIELVQASINEVDGLFETFNELENNKSLETFIPLGAGSFVKGNVKKTNEVIVSIGSGLAVKKDVAGAREIISSQKKELQNSLDKMLANLQQVTDMVSNLTYQVEQISAASQGNMTQLG